MRCTYSASQRIHTSYGFNAFNILSETLMLYILKTERFLGRLRIDGFNRHIHIRQEYKMIARRRLIVDSRVKLDEAHYPWSIELQTKDIGANCLMKKS